MLGLHTCKCLGVGSKREHGAIVNSKLSRASRTVAAMAAVTTTRMAK
jgi:hypothetical protein